MNEALFTLFIYFFLNEAAVFGRQAGPASPAWAQPITTKTFKDNKESMQAWPVSISPWQKLFSKIWEIT